jgi:hypothetical protein
MIEKGTFTNSLHSISQYQQNFKYKPQEITQKIHGHTHTHTHTHTHIYMYTCISIFSKCTNSNKFIEL